jgi:hypothetical protein
MDLVGDERHPEHLEHDRHLERANGEGANHLLASLATVSINPTITTMAIAGAAHTYGYGAAAQLVRKRLGTLDGVGIVATLRLERSLSDVRPVATQGVT